MPVASEVAVTPVVGAVTPDAAETNAENAMVMPRRDAVELTELPLA